jgi:hypothetical protein
VWESSESQKLLHEKEAGFAMIHESERPAAEVDESVL